MDFDAKERALLEALPAPPTRANASVTNVWVIEWLYDDDRLTGQELHAWLNLKRPGWAAYLPCLSKADVFKAIDRATDRALRSGMRPVLHVESHGGADGISGTNGSGGIDFVYWSEMAEPLQRLNAATHCNVLLVMAACTGVAAMQVFDRGPRAPAAALAGFDSEIGPSALLEAMKEFYRRQMDNTPNLTDMAASASREAGGVHVAVEPFALLAYEALAERLVRQRLARAALPSAIVLQRLWDELFMIDIEPANRERFGLDMHAVHKILADFRV